MIQNHSQYRMKQAWNVFWDAQSLTLLVYGIPRPKREHPHTINHPSGNGLMSFYVNHTKMLDLNPQRSPIPNIASALCVKDRSFGAWLGLIFSMVSLKNRGFNTQYIQSPRMPDSQHGPAPCVKGRPFGSFTLLTDAYPPHEVPTGRLCHAHLWWQIELEFQARILIFSAIHWVGKILQLVWPYLPGAFETQHNLTHILCALFFVFFAFRHLNVHVTQRQSGFLTIQKYSQYHMKQAGIFFCLLKVYCTIWINFTYNSMSWRVCTQTRQSGQKLNSIYRYKIYLYH